MSYKVGDKVRVREDLIGDKKYGRQLFARKMERYKGLTAIICKISPDGYNLDISQGWYWSDEMLLPYKFTKSDLKDGMVVEFGNKKRAILINGIFLVKDVDITNIGEFNDDLTNCGGCERYRIDKVFRVNRAHGIDSILSKSDSCELTLLWKRNPKRMTHAEIEKALGYEFTYVQNRHINDLWKIFEE